MEVLPLASVLYILLTLSSLVVALLIGLSRISDNKHHPIDVISGWILGAFVACAIVSYQFKVCSFKDVSQL